eukprot:9409189-Pyramimonas_sp.AAC.1
MHRGSRGALRREAGRKYGRSGASRSQGQSLDGRTSDIVEDDRWRGNMLPNTFQMSKTCVKH